MNTLSTQNLFVILIIIITSIISCARYLSIIQLNNFYFNSLFRADQNNLDIPLSIAKIISFFTLFITFMFLKPIYLLSIFLQTSLMSF